jgi:hypothetical protein
MKMQIREEPGWTGAFTRDQAHGVEFANGTRIVKARGERGDRTPVGMTGTVLGSLCHPGLGAMYFVEWDDQRRVAVAAVDWKLARAPHQAG